MRIPQQERHQNRGNRGPTKQAADQRNAGTLRQQKEMISLSQEWHPRTPVNNHRLSSREQRQATEKSADIAHCPAG